MAQKKITGQQVDVALDDISSVDVSAASEGQVLTYASGVWVAATPTGGASQPSLPSSTETFP